MASTLVSRPLTHISLTQPKPISLTRPKPKPKPTQIHCGPRSNRGPLQKGRILSSEAILAIQSLKRSKTNPNPHVSLSRLLKSDLISTLHELLRQNELTLSLQVFSTVRSEPWYTPSLSLYADIILALSRAAMWHDVDRLIITLDEEMESLDDRKGLGRLIRGLIAAERKESVVRVYQGMKRVGWGVVGSGVEVDEYLCGVLRKGFVRFGEVELAKEVEDVLEAYLNACLGRPV